MAEIIIDKKRFNKNIKNNEKNRSKYKIRKSNNGLRIIFFYKETNIDISSRNWNNNKWIKISINVVISLKNLIEKIVIRQLKIIRQSFIILTQFLEKQTKCCKFIKREFKKIII